MIATSIAWMLILLGNGIDYVTTVKGLQRGATEQNPLIDTTHLLRFKLIATAAQMAVVGFVVPQEYHVLAGLVILAIYIVVGFRNDRQ
jgi:hypothetical protein